MLSDGHAVYTPGLSESRGGVSSYAASDVLGNLWFLDNSATAQSYYQDTSAFGGLSAVGGTTASPFKYGGANGCQTDADTGLVLMGHRYYDTRLGRFISQDPIGDGDNWYAYAGNDPVDETDPTGLFTSTGMGWGAIYDQASAEGGPGSEWYTRDQNNNILDHFFVSSADMGIGTPGAGMGMFAGDHHTADGSKWYRNKVGDHDPPHIHRGIDGPRYNREGKEVKPNGELKPGGGSVKKSQMDKFRKVFDELNPPRPGAAVTDGEAAAELGGDVVVGAEVGADLMGPVGLFVGAAVGAYDWYRNGPPRGTLLVPGPGYPF